MTTEHKIEIREAEYDALIRLYEASGLLMKDYTNEPIINSLARIANCYTDARKEVEKPCD